MKIAIAGSVLTWDFEDGGENISLDVSTLPQDMRDRLEVHGAKQKIADAYAGAKQAVEEGDYPDAATYAREMVTAAIKKLQNSDWTSREPGAGRVTDLARALGEVTEFSVEDWSERLESATKEEKAALRKQPQVAAVLARLKAERAAATAAQKEKAAESAETEFDPTAFFTSAAEA